MIVVAVDAQTGKVSGDAELVLRGLVLTGADDEAVFAEARQRVAKVLQRTSNEGVTDHGVIKKALRDSLSQFIWERSRRRPMIIPVVMEV